MRLLGINIDNKLNFSEHVKIVTVKAGRQVGVLMRLRNLIPEKVKLQLYKTAILTSSDLLLCRLAFYQSI